MPEEGQYMKCDLYRAAQCKGTSIPDEDSNFQSQTFGNCNNALHVAAQYNNSGFITEALGRLDNEIYYQRLCQRNSKGETPLHLAAQFGHMEVVRDLVLAHDNREGAGSFLTSKKLCWSKRDKNRDTPLHMALRNGHEKIAMMLLDKDMQLVSVINDAGESLAYLAAENFCNKFLMRILEASNRCSINFSGPFRQTAFHSARRLPEELMLELIDINGGALLKAQDCKGKTVVHYAVEEDRRPMVVILLRVDCSLAYVQDNDSLTPLHIAFKNGSLPMIRIIMEMCPQSIELHDDHGRSALHVAKMESSFLQNCRRTSITRMNILINQVDNDGNTPLHVALINSKQEAAYELLEVTGCNWRLRNKDGCNPLDLCKSNDKILRRSAVYVLLSSLVDGQQRLSGVKWARYIMSKIFKALFTINLEGKESKDWEQLLDKLNIVAVLLLPLAFQATFNVPGGYDGKTGQPVLFKNAVFQGYLSLNFIAVLSTVFILIAGTFGISKRLSKRKLARISIRYLQLALASSFSAYILGVVALRGKLSKTIMYYLIGVVLVFAINLYLLSQALLSY